MAKIDDAAATPGNTYPAGRSRHRFETGFFIRSVPEAFVFLVDLEVLNTAIHKSVNAHSEAVHNGRYPVDVSGALAV